jgi:hypothetical protein
MAEALTTIDIECNHCGPVVAPVHGIQSLYNDDTPEPQDTVMCHCPKCDQPLLAQRWYFDEYWSAKEGAVGSYTPFKRVWPSPDLVIPFELPALVRDSLVEAQKTLRAGAFIACAAMCGRALEALCHDLGANTTLGKGLTDLHTNGKSDGRLYEWGRELNAKRNIAAHANPTPISKRDAEYLFDFSIAICDYIYVLSAKFERFKNGE